MSETTEEFQRTAARAVAHVQEHPRNYLGLRPSDRRLWRRYVRAAGVQLTLCPYCGFPGKVNGLCPVCVPPQEAG